MEGLSFGAKTSNLSFGRGNMGTSIGLSSGVSKPTFSKGGPAIETKGSSGGKIDSGIRSSADKESDIIRRDMNKGMSNLEKITWYITNGDFKGLFNEYPLVVIGLLLGLLGIYLTIKRG